MDKLYAEKKVEIEKKIETENKPLPKLSIKIKETPPVQKTEYLNSLDNMTLADYKRMEEEKKAKESNLEKEKLIQVSLSEEKTPAQSEFEKVIEKPNYDFIEENKKIVKLKKKEKPKAKNKKKLAGIMLACALGASALICVTNTVIIDNMNSNFLQIDETYKVNLASYLKNIYNLDVTQKSMEMIETYPEDILDAGDLGQKSNWFDRLCNFLGGLFGG